VLLEASLSFLGLGIPPPAPSWGGLIADGRDRLLDAWWISTWPGLALAGVVIAASLVADGARERL
jgi:peptide/nickel transport system permease protein